ncbi:carbohydrate esterase family 8 protein [Vararia minispora EC-137]|uniref:Carbohydrate esterase family 8 protein n=1 Tax=Vararia minispora EC-137 TaxID=1314806 RepID=A0ACB8QS47_9AGAM|nr:carbohydrate esterase family 8 protein [Vararia minispora EC-137]
MILTISLLLLQTLSVCALSPPGSRTTPPSGAYIVRTGTTVSGEFKNLVSAVAALPADSSPQTIFIYPGTYTGQVLLQRSGPVTIYGYTTNAGSQAANQVTLTAAGNATAAGSDDASGTLRIHTNNVKVYNINVKNSVGPGVQAIALSNYGDMVGLYACGFYGYQDTVYTNQGRHAFLQGYIAGAVDFIFGKLSQAYFEGNTIAIAGSGAITANGRSADDAGIYLFDRNTIATAPSVSVNGNYFFGRPWRDYARVIFKNTVVTAPINAALWERWSSATPMTDHVTYDDYNTTGSGVPNNVQRPSFATLLTASQAATFTIATSLGSDYANWVDTSYLF